MFSSCEQNYAIFQKPPYWCTSWNGICAVFGCFKQSGHDKDVSFHRITAITSIQGKDDFELRNAEMDFLLPFQGKM